VAERQSLAANVLLSLGVTVLLLGGSEGICRWLEHRHPAPAVADYIWDWDKQWEGDFYTVSSDAVGWPPHEEFNGDGVRDRAHPIEKPEGTWRVAALGDSVTMGAGLKPEEAYPQALQASLDAAGRLVEVFNVALWGWSPRQETIAYRRIVRPYKPDQVLLGVCLNDIPELQNNLARPAPWIAALHERSALVRRVVNARGREIGSVEELFEKRDSAKLREAWARFFEEVLALRDEVKADGARLVLVVFPFRFQVVKGAPEPIAQREIAAFCASERIECLDLLPRLLPAGEAAFLDYDHLSASGARLVAESILATGLLPALRADPAVASATAPERGAAALAEAVARDPRERVRAGAARALGGMGEAGRAAFPALFKALGDPRENVRWSAARALWSLGSADSRWLGPLVSALDSSDPYVRGFAAWSLGEIGPAAKDAAPALVAALEREEAYGRGGAAAALAKLGPYAGAAVPALVRSLRSADERARWNAARTLGRIGPEARDAIPALIDALADSQERVRAHAARALGRIGSRDKRSLAALEHAARDSERSVRKEARAALRGLGQD
jgi:HEAT repeat protein